MVGNYTLTVVDLDSSTFDIKWAIFSFLALAALDHGIVWRYSVALSAVLSMQNLTRQRQILDRRDRLRRHIEAPRVLLLGRPHDGNQ